MKIYIKIRPAYRQLGKMCKKRLNLYGKMCFEKKTVICFSVSNSDANTKMRCR